MPYSRLIGTWGRHACVGPSHVSPPNGVPQVSASSCSTPFVRCAVLVASNPLRSRDGPTRIEILRSREPATAFADATTRAPHLTHAAETH